MYHKLLFSILFTITSCFSLVAQSNDLLYQAEIQAAQNDLKDEQFRSTIPKELKENGKHAKTMESKPFSNGCLYRKITACYVEIFRGEI
jgi:hypothetical protein